MLLFEVWISNSEIGVHENYMLGNKMIVANRKHNENDSSNDNDDHSSIGSGMQLLAVFVNMPILGLHYSCWELNYHLLSCVSLLCQRK